MKITVKEKSKEENQNVPFNKIPVGYVYVVGFSDGPTTLKLKDNEAVLLNYCNGEDYLEIANPTEGFNGEPAYRILGKLVEIIVEEM